MTVAAEHDVPIPYMQRTRDYYQALGFAPYRWAHFADVPFTPLAKPLAQSRVALITTAAPFQPGVGDQGPGAKYNAAAKFYKVYSDSTETIPDLRISHVGYDRKHTTADDPRTWLPLAALQQAVKAGRIGSAHSAVSRGADQPQPAGDDGDRRARAAEALPRGRRRGGRPRPQLTGVSPDRESGESPSGSERDPDRHHGRGQGHRRALRRPAVPLQRLPARQLGRQAARRGVAGAKRWSWRCACWRPRRARARRCSRRSAGATMRPGSSTSTTSPSSLPKIWKSGARSSTW